MDLSWESSWNCDSQLFSSLYQKKKEKVGHPQGVAVDDGYKIPYISKRLMDDYMRLVTLYASPMRTVGIGNFRDIRNHFML